MVRYLITGGAGFIGSSLAHALVARKKTVRILDDFSTGQSVTLRGIEASVEILRGDLCDAEAVGCAVADVDVVLHEAALNSNPHSIQEESPALSKTGEISLLPKAPYGVSKLAAELYCRVFAQVYGLETVSLRYFNVFGPRQLPDSEYAAVIPRFLRRMVAGQRPVIYGDGEQSRDFTPVANVVAANLCAAETSQGIGGAFNVACGQASTLNQLVVWLNAELGTNLPPLYEPPRPADIRHSYASIRLAESLLGYRPRVTIREGLSETVAWFTRHEC